MRSAVWTRESSLELSSRRELTRGGCGTAAEEAEDLLVVVEEVVVVLEGLRAERFALAIVCVE